MNRRGAQAECHSICLTKQLTRAKDSGGLMTTHSGALSTLSHSRLFKQMHLAQLQACNAMPDHAAVMVIGGMGQMQAPRISCRLH